MLFLWAGRYLLELMHLRQESVSIAGGVVDVGANYSPENNFSRATPPAAG